MLLFANRGGYDPHCRCDIVKIKLKADMKLISGSFSGGDEMDVYSRTAMCYARVSAESHRYAP